MDNVLRVFVRNGDGIYGMMESALRQLTQQVLFTDIISMTPIYDENGLTLIVVHN